MTAAAPPAWLRDRSGNALMMPSTVPNRPMNGALLPSVPSTPRLRSSRGARAPSRWPSPRRPPRRRGRTARGRRRRPAARAARRPASAAARPRRRRRARKRSSSLRRARRRRRAARRKIARSTMTATDTTDSADEQPQHPLGTEEREAENSFGQMHSVANASTVHWRQRAGATTTVAAASTATVA